MEVSRLTRDGTAEPVSRKQILRHVRGQGIIHFRCSADHEQDWQPYPVGPLLYVMTIHTDRQTTITGTRIGLGRAEGRRKSARNRKIAVDTARETGETWGESEKNVEKKGLVQ